MTPRRSKEATSRFVLFLALCLGVAGMGLLAVILAVRGFFARSKDEKQAAKDKIAPAETKVGDETKSTRDTGRKEDRPSLEKEKPDEGRLERERTVPRCRSPGFPVGATKIDGR